MLRAHVACDSCLSITARSRLKLQTSNRILTDYTSHNGRDIQTHVPKDRRRGLQDLIPTRIDALGDDLRPWLCDLIRRNGLII